MMAGITNKGPLGVCAPCSPHGGLSRHFAQRRLADAFTRAAVGAGGADRLGRRPRLSGGDLGRPDRLPGPPARHRLLQRLRRRDPCARRQAGRALRSAASARARNGDLRREDSILRLALSAVLPRGRGRARADAVSAGADRVAGRDVAPLSLRHPCDRRERSSSPPRGPEGSARSAPGWEPVAPPRARLSRPCS